MRTIKIMQKNNDLSISRSYKKEWKFWVGIILTVLALGWLIFNTNWLATMQALSNANYLLVITAIFVNLLTIPMRASRWWLLFPSDNPAPIRRLTSAMLIGQTVNIISPMRLGDLLRATLVNTHKTTFVLGTQVVQFALDLLMMGGIALFLLSQISVPIWWRGSGEILLLTIAITLIAIVLLTLRRHWLIAHLQRAETRWPRWQRVFTIGIPFLRSFDNIAQPNRLGMAIGNSILIWIFYNIVNYILLLAVGIKPTVIMTLLLLIVLLAGASIPSTPGRIGVYHYLVTQFLLLFGVDEATAISFAILQHFIALILPSIIGITLAWRLSISLTHLPLNGDGQEMTETITTPQ